MVAVVVHESATAQEAAPLDGVAAEAKGETVITFLELRIQKIPRRILTKMSGAICCMNMLCKAVVGAPVGTYPNWNSKPSIPCRSRASSENLCRPKSLDLSFLVKVTHRIVAWM